MLASDYRSVEIAIGDRRIGVENRESQPVFNPATGEELGRTPSISQAELVEAVEVAHDAFATWKRRSPLERSAILRRFGDLLRRDEKEIATHLTMDQGKPFGEALAEVRASADMADWHAEEGRRLYGRIIPARTASVQQHVIREPVGVCLAISPWNFPMSQAVRKVACALAAGCTLILKGPGETPSAIMAISRLLREAGLPDGCLNLVWGEPALISETLLACPEVRKLSFTGSVPGGKHLAALAGQYMKRVTMELGGHAPVLVFDDVDPIAVDKALTAYKLRNAGQVCISPTRIFVQEGVYNRFLPAFADAFASVEVGNGLAASTRMGPLCHGGRIAVMERLVADARSAGASVATGGARIGNEGHFFAPTIVETRDDSIALMREEPFGPIAVVTSFSATDEALTRANSLPFGLASYVFTNSLEHADFATAELRAGMVSVNHFGLALPETPFGGINDSGFGSEGGSEAFDGYLNTKFVSRLSTPVK